jgi:hypothetical protein
MDLYKELEHNDIGVLKDKEIGQTMIQNTVMETLENNFNRSKYVIQIGRKSKQVIYKKGEESVTKREKSKKEDKDNKSDQAVVKMTKTFEDMMLQFQHMVQLNQLIQMNQMNQIQIMNQLVELKGNVVETRQDLSFKLKEINQRIDEVSSKRTYARKSDKKDVQESIEDEEDYSHLIPLRIENVYSLYERRDIDENYVKNVLKSKSPSGFMKIFDLLYRCKDKSKRDIYPIRLIKAKTFQYYNEDGEWILDTNGVNIIKIICANISLLFSKINNDYFEGEDIDMFDFVDNQTFIQEVDDKKIKNQLLMSIRDVIVNHHMNYKPNKKENSSEKKSSEKNSSEKKSSEEDQYKSTLEE